VRGGGGGWRRGEGDGDGAVRKEGIDEEEVVRELPLLFASALEWGRGGGGVHKG
jgi:hypothetical protein